MIKLQDYTPEIYYKQSRDFQLLGRLYDVVLNSIKTSADALYGLPKADRTMQTRILDLLSYTLGFTAKHEYSNTQLAAVCSVFPSLIKLKGSIQAIQLLGDTLLSAEGINEKFSCYAEGNTIQLFIPGALSTLTLFNDLLDYLLPAGMSCNIVRANTESVAIATEIATKVSGVHFFREGSNKRINLENTSIIPSILPNSSDKTITEMANYTRYTSRDEFIDIDTHEPYYSDAYLNPGMIGNTAILDYGKAVGLSKDPESKVYDNLIYGKAFYDIKYWLPIRTGTTPQNLDVNPSKTGQSPLDLWCKAAGVAVAPTARNVAVGFNSDTDDNIYTEMRYSAGNHTDGLNDTQYLTLELGTKIATSTLNFPNKQLLEAAYGNKAKIIGYTVTISKVINRALESEVSRKFTIYDADTAKIVKCLSGLTGDDLLPTADLTCESSYTLNLDYVSATEFSLPAVITEPIKKLSIDTTQNAKGKQLDPRLGADNLEQLAQETWLTYKPVCLTYFPVEDNTNAVTTIIPPRAEGSDDAITDAQGNPLHIRGIQESNEERIYPVYTHCWSTQTFTSLRLPQLYKSENGTIFSGRFNLIIKPIFETI